MFFFLEKSLKRKIEDSATELLLIVMIRDRNDIRTVGEVAFFLSYLSYLVMW